MKTLVNRRRPILVLHSQPHALQGYLLGCYTSWVFSSPFLFSSLSSLLLQIELFKCIVWQP